MAALSTHAFTQSGGKHNVVPINVLHVNIEYHKTANFHVCIIFDKTSIVLYDKKAVLSQGNRAMPQHFFSVQKFVIDSIHKLQKPGFRAPNITVQNRI